MSKRRWVIAVLVGLWAQSLAGADERIIGFHSDITVHEDGWLTVTETIRVRAEGDRIKRGIYRDFPVLHRGRGWTAVRVPFDVSAVKRDGKGEAHHFESKGKYRRVYLGRSGVVLKPGIHTYTLSYRTARQVGFFDDHDELYWNVTGNEWDFAIDRASARITVPAGVPRSAIKLEAYTGPKGAKAGQYSASLDASGSAVFETTSPLGKHEGLTVVVSFPKGFVAEPTAWEKLEAFLGANSLVGVGALGLLAVLLYFAVAWYHIGRDPDKGVIIPLFEPPEDLSAAGMRYVLEMGFDQKCLTAAILNMAVKGYWTIEEADGDYALVRTEGADDAKLAREERKVARKLLGHGDAVDLDNANHTRFTNATTGLKQVLADEFEGRYFLSNLKWFVPGVILGVLTLVGVGAVSFLQQGQPVVGFLSIWLSIWSLGVWFLVRQVIKAWQAVRRGTGGRLGKTGAAVFITVFAVPFCIAEVVVFSILVYMTSIWLMPILLAIGILIVRFHHLLKRPTVEGRKVMDLIEGFRMYLATAEQDRLSAVHVPERTPAVFEACLPYAIALDVENEWAEQFADVLADAGVDEQGYRPLWYHGAGFAALGAAGFASAVGGTLTSALSSASAAPGSSSGMGGGGSSGGGGGGGGGGGW